MPLLLTVFLMALGSGCTIRKLAVNQLGDALAGSSATFARDDDPELVRQAVPFSLKLIEGLLSESPRHQGLLLAATKGFAQYSYAFVQLDADETEDKDLQAATVMRDRASHLFVRARNYGLRGLEARHPGFQKLLRSDAAAAARLLKKEEVPVLYWTAVSWAAAINLSKDDSDLLADLPAVEVLVDRAIELQEDYDSGGLRTFLISFESTRKGQTGDLAARIRKHYERALELAKGTLAGPLVSYAEVMSVKNQNLAEFESLLKQALAIDVNARPEYRLENLLMQRRAKWLLSRKDQLFLLPDKNDTGK
jgi:predicted anti-sigma-YlaC factor YlaD